MAKKRGQVTFFIIIAIVVIVLILLVVSLFKTPFKPDLSGSRIEVVKDFVKGCAEETTRNGLKIMGLSGGLTEISKDFIPRSAVNVFSNSLLLGDNEVMYWYYKSVNNLDIINVPDKVLMEEQLGKYISDNLDKCLHRFERLKFEGYKIESGDVNASVKIKDTRVDVKVEMPTIVVIGDNSLKINDYSSSVKSNFGRLYNAGKEIIESNSDYLEDLTFDTIALDEEIPLSDTEFDCRERRWEKDKITARLRYLLSRNIRAVKLKGTSFGDIEPYYQWDAMKNSYKDVNANLMYSNEWPLYLKVDPSDNGLLKSDDIVKLEDNAKFLNGIFCLQNWNFVYDVKYPVLITLNSGDDILQFGYMVVLENNQAKKNTIAKEDYGEFKEDFCSKKLGKVNVIVLAPKSDGSYNSVGDANMFFKCFNFECSLGKSDFNGDFDGDVPQCVNGNIIARKEGYFEGKLPISSNQLMSGGVKLEPIYELNLDILMFFGDSVRGLSGNENAILELRSLDRDYSVSVIYPDSKKVRLIAGRYNVSSVIMSKGADITIKGESVEKCVDTGGLLSIFGFGSEKCSSVDVPDLILNDVVIGGNVNLIEVPRNLLGFGRTITLYSYYDGAPSNTEEYGSIYERINTNRLKEKYGYEIK